jgi:hypothetical protein
MPFELTKEQGRQRRDPSNEPLPPWFQTEAKPVAAELRLPIMSLEFP